MISRSGVRLRIPEYLEYLRSLECAVCHSKRNVVPAHGEPWGKGMKGPDWEALPLCGECHGAEHRGRKTFWSSVEKVLRITREGMVDIYTTKFCKIKGISKDELCKVDSSGGV